MKIEIHRCDQCGKDCSKESVVLQLRNLKLTGVDGEPIINHTDAMDFCGQGCVISYVSELMAGVL